MELQETLTIGCTYFKQAYTIDALFEKFTWLMVLAEVDVNVVPKVTNPRT